MDLHFWRKDYEHRRNESCEIFGVLSISPMLGWQAHKTSNRNSAETLEVELQCFLYECALTFNRRYRVNKNRLHLSSFFLSVEVNRSSLNKIYPGY